MKEVVVIVRRWCGGGGVVCPYEVDEFDAALVRLLQQDICTDTFEDMEDA